MIDKLQAIDLNIIKWIQSTFSFKFLDYVMYALTHLGDKFVFILIGVIIFWTIDKKFAYKLVLAFLGSAVANAVLKKLFMRPRPYKEVGVRSIITDTHGTSFPSGHSQASGVLFYSLNNEYGSKYKYMKYLSYAILIIVPLTRMYLGQHYLTDVIVGTIIGIVAAIVGFKLFDLMGEKEHIYPLYLIPVFIVALLVIYPWRNVAAGYENVKDMFVASGGFIGFVIGYAVEKLYVKHNVQTTFTNKVLKLVSGLIIIASLYFGMKFVFPDNSLIFDLIRYGVVGFAASAGVPYLFTKVFKQAN